MIVPEVGKPYRSRRRLVGFSYDPKMQLASLSAYVPGSNRRLNEITTAQVKSFETKLKRRGYALATVNDYLNVLLMLLHRAVDDLDLIEEFPIKKRLKRKRPEPLALELTEEERTRFLSAFDDEEAFRADLNDNRLPRSIRPDGDAAKAAFLRLQYLKPLFVIAIETRLRRGDLLALKRRSVDFENRWIHIVMHKTKLPVIRFAARRCWLNPWLQSQPGAFGWRPPGSLSS